MRTTINLSVEGFDIAADIARIEGLSTTLPDTLAQVALDVGTDAVLSAAAEIRGSLSMSNNAQARTLDALPILRPGETHAEAEIVAVPRGAWSLVEYGAKPHTIDPKRASAGRRRKRALSVPPYGVFSKVNHPGTRPTGTWEQAMAAAEPIIDEAVQEAFDTAVAPDTSGAV